MEDGTDSPALHEIKQKTIQRYAKRYNIDTLVETRYIPWPNDTGTASSFQGTSFC